MTPVESIAAVASNIYMICEAVLVTGAVVVQTFEPELILGHGDTRHTTHEPLAAQQAKSLGDVTAVIPALALFSIGGSSMIVMSPIYEPYHMALQLAQGAMALLSAAVLTRRAWVHGAKEMTRLRQQTSALDHVITEAQNPQALAETMRNRPDIICNILSDLQKEIAAKLAKCTQTKIDWDSVIGVCDDMIAEMHDLDVAPNHPAFCKILELKSRAELEITCLASAAQDLITQAQKIPAWIADQRIRAVQLREKLSREKRLQDLHDKLTRLIGRVDALSVAHRETMDQTTSLTSEINAIGELMSRVDAMTEVEAYLALPQLKEMPEKELCEWREQVAAKRRTLAAGRAHG